MKLLLDTHIALWAVENNPKLSVAARARINEPDALVFVSTASLCEIAIKAALKKEGPGAIRTTARLAHAAFVDAGFEMIDITADHARAMDDLPRLHGDPFDRLLVAQALAEPLRLLTHDAKVAAYSDTVILV